MDISFELLSSMSPRINRNKSNAPPKSPSILALKKHIRRSSGIGSVNCHRKNESIITIESSSTSADERSTSNESPILLSSENSDDESPFVKDSKSFSYNLPIRKRKEANGEIKKVQNSISQLSQEKFSKIKTWIDDVNRAKKKSSNFNKVPTSCDESNNCIKASDTEFGTTSSRSDGLFKKKLPNNGESTKKFADSFMTDENSFENDHGNLVPEINSLTENCQNLVLDDSFKLGLKESLLTTSKEKQSPLNVGLSNRETIKKFSENVTVNSFMTDENSFKNDHTNLVPEINSLTENCQNLVLDDSFKLGLKESLISTRSKEKQFPLSVGFETPSNKDVTNSDEYEDLLDSIYGNSWRQRKDVLPSSEPQFKGKKNETNKKVNTGRSTKAVNIRKNLHLPGVSETDDLLKKLQKTRLKNAVQSPWMKSIKNVCDSDTDPESSDNCHLSPTKLSFDEDVDDLIDQKTSSEPPSVNKTRTKTKKVVAVASTPTKVGKINNEAESYSFLASLSGNVPISKSDASALIYRNNFKQNKEELASKLFVLYNQSIFENAIPSDTPLEWNNRMRGTAGYCHCRKTTRKSGVVQRTARIVISSKVVDSADRLRDTLVHEMCHAVTWIVNQVADGHGSFWRFWAERAMEIFPELPPIKRCHQYVINTKYTYRCVNCAYSVGRHTKSLDVERKRCGYCFGKFEILINKTTRKGETKTVPATPKKTLTGFALFVKENYAAYKTREFTHADVMKMLGQKFADLKMEVKT